MDDDFKYIKIINEFLPIVEKKWVYNNNCYKCNSEFGNLINRQHHCRACGRSYCWNCCHNKIDFAEDIIKAPKEEKTYKKSINNFFGYSLKKSNDDSKLVCDICYPKLWKLSKIEIYIRICGFFDLSDLMNIMLVSKKYYKSAIYWLCKFRRIQINPKTTFGNWESNIIKTSIKYFNGHSLWIKESIKLFLLERYNSKKDSSVFHFESIGNCMQNDKNICCESLNCYNICQNNLNIYDFVEILEYITYLENKYKKMFWESYGLRSNLKMILQKIYQPNNLIIKKVLPIIIILLLKLLNTKIEIDDDFLHLLFDLLLVDSKKVCIILNDIELLKNNKYENENSSVNFVSSLEKYIEKKNIDINENLIKIKNLRDFTVNIYYYDNLSNINSKLPLIYYFDFDMEIIEIDHTVIYKNNKNTNDYALYLSAKVKYLSKIINKKILIRRTSNFDEYYNCNLIKIIRDKMLKYSVNNGSLLNDIPISDTMIISNNFLVIELPEDSIFVSDLYSRKMTIKDYVCHTASTKTVEKMMNNFISSLSLMSVLACFFNFKINDYSRIMINKKEQIFIVNFNQEYTDDELKNSLYITKSMCDILGPKNGYHFGLFARKTIELYDNLKIQNGFINSYLRGILNSSNETYFEIKSINDIKIIKVNI